MTALNIAKKRVSIRHLRQITGSSATQQVPNGNSSVMPAVQVGTNFCDHEGKNDSHSVHRVCNKLPCFGAAVISASVEAFFPVRTFGATGSHVADGSRT